MKTQNWQNPSQEVCSKQGDSEAAQFGIFQTNEE